MVRNMLKTNPYIKYVKHVFEKARNLLPTPDIRFYRYIENSLGCKIKDIKFGDIYDVYRHDSVVLVRYKDVSFDFVCRDDNIRVVIRKPQYGFNKDGNINLVIGYLSIDVDDVGGGVR